LVGPRFKEGLGRRENFKKPRGRKVIKERKILKGRKTNSSRKGTKFNKKGQKKKFRFF